ncbi:MAG: hypothetical protein WBV55_23515 [Candidatus Sulfotelmatobacter sp.]
MKPKSPPPKAYSDIEVVRLLWLAIFVSVFSFLFYYRHGDVLLYGDAVAHINIARRVFDSKTPGLLQLGTVWLPLPHLLILPFIVSQRLWQTGAGGSIPSMAAYVFGVLGIFRLVRIALTRNGQVDDVAKLGPWLAAILYAANPNLIYMQATAMGESLYLAFFIWAIVYFAEFARGNSKALTKCSLCVAAASLTRYDGWFLAALLVPGAVIIYSRVRKQPKEEAPKTSQPPLRSHIIKFVLIAAAGPALWLAYNAAVYGNPLEFANGPYSAKSIAKKTATVNPAKGNLWASTSYFLKASELNVAHSDWLGRTWLALALLGSLVSWFERRGRAALLLWTPIPFYALSIAYGSVPIFVPTWWPFSQYNVRYGLQLLPALAVFVPLAISFLLRFAAKLPQVPPSWPKWAAPATLLVTLFFASASYAAIWRVNPICYQEADVNMKGRVALDRQLGKWLEELPPNSTLLMYLGEHVGALEQVGIPLRRTINEGNHRVWKQPLDPDGLWERALADPAAYADYAIGFQGDPVWTAAHDHHLTALVEIHTTGQPPAAIFQARAPQGRTQPPVPRSTQ